MSSSKRMTHLSALLAAVGAAAIAAAFAIGMTGWPPARANAAELLDVGFVSQEEITTPGFSLESTSAASDTATATPSDVGTLTVTTMGTFVPVPASTAKTAGGKDKVLLSQPKPKKTFKRHAPKKRRVARRLYAGPWQSARVSWYGPGFYGNTMAGGGQLTRASMIVAHRSLPFGTKIQFSYRGRTAIAVVRDRGPYVSGRTFDLGPGVARTLRFSGVDTVRYRIIKR